MTYLAANRLKLALPRGSKTDVRVQFAALAYRRTKSGKVKICLITSRRTKRWIVPKGWPMRRTSAAKAVKTEAFEEAGLIGNVNPRALGLFSYEKVISKKKTYPVIAVLYAFEVTEVLDTWPEASQRERKWFGRKTAAAKLNTPGLSPIVAEFDPDRL